MRKIKIAAIILFLIFVKQINAQSNTPKVIPPSPEASNIARYADIPVSLYTGKPQIEFPLYTLKCGNIKLPISLSYYAAGIRIEDYPTWTGIGWALNAGGVIARTIRGPVRGIGGNNLGQYLPISSYPSLTDFNNLVSLGDGYHNTEGDIFYYNFCQYTGSFQIKNNEPVFRKYANLKIEFPILLTTITITDENGNKYYFEPEIAAGVVGNDYYLKKIESVNKSDIIYFEYIQGDIYMKPPHNSEFYSLKNTVSKIGTTGQIQEAVNSGKLLRKIYTSNNDSVVFIKKDIAQPGYSNSYDTHRQALDAIVVYSSNSKLLSFHLKTNNIQSIKPYSKYLIGYPQLNTSKDMNYRLYLDGFDKLDKTGNIVMSYSFDYYGRTNDGRDSLANRYSFAQDLGGYYNGQDNNTSLIPSFNQTISPRSDYQDTYVDYNNYISNVNISGANRNPNLQYMKMGTLKSIKYPTGGCSKFYFSQMDNPIVQQELLWGLNVDKIEYLNSDGSLQKCKRYSYSQPVLGYPIPSYWHYTFFDLITNQTSPFPYCNQSLTNQCPMNWGWALELSPNNTYDIGMNEGPLVGYGHVEEIEDGNGKTVYAFSIEGNCQEENADYYFTVDGLKYYYDSQYPQGIRFETNNLWPLGPIPNNSWKMGTLIGKKTYSENNSLIQEVNYYYSHAVLGTVPGVKIFPVKQDFFYLYYQFEYLSTLEKLDSVAETINGVSKITRYQYNDRNQITQIKTNNSDGRLLTTKLKYPSDINTAVYDSMKNLNMLNYPIEETTLVSSNITSSKLTTYKANSSSYVPDKVYSLETTTPLASSSFTAFTGSTKDTRYSQTPEYSFESYNSSNGNPLKVLGKNGIYTYYVWAYNKTYPVAKIESSTNVTISITVDDTQLKKTTVYADIVSDVNYLKGLLNSYITNNDYMVTLYTYSCLIGLTSQTDPSGKTTYYEYDTFGRLKLIRDDQNNILKKFDYHYSTQN